ncbi:MAG: hypothetical protein ACC631_09505 [Halocynthiibacter sp.]
MVADLVTLAIDEGVGYPLNLRTIEMRRYWTTRHFKRSSREVVIVPRFLR